MSYIQSALLPGESIMFRARIHWAIFLSGILWALLSASFFAVNDKGNVGDTMGKLLAAVAGYKLLSALVYWYSTELAITSKRVIVKTGLISRDTIELLHSKVESVAVKQSIVGRMLGFGSVTIGGTGGKATPLRGVDNPLLFRAEALQQVDAVG